MFVSADNETGHPDYYWYDTPTCTPYANCNDWNSTIGNTEVVTYQGRQWYNLTQANDIMQNGNVIPPDTTTTSYSFKKVFSSTSALNYFDLVDYTNSDNYIRSFKDKAGGGAGLWARVRYSGAETTNSVAQNYVVGNIYEFCYEISSTETKVYMNGSLNLTVTKALNFENYSILRFWDTAIGSLVGDIRVWSGNCSQEPTAVDTMPHLTLLSQNNTITNSSQIDYLVYDNDNATLICDLFVDGSKTLTNSSVLNNTQSKFNPSISFGTHTYYINCTDGTSIDVSQTQYITYIQGYMQYQETADQFGDCNARWLPAYPCTLINDGDYTTQAVFDGTGGQSGFAYANYTKPTGAVRNTSFWQVKDQNTTGNTVNLTIPQACWDAYPNMLRFQIVNTDALAGTTQWVCHNGAGFAVSMRLASGALIHQPFEEAMHWHILPCTPDWVCAGYGACNISDLAPCNSTTDNNACGQAYTGNFSEFTPQSCDYCDDDTSLVVGVCDSITDTQTLTYTDANWNICCNITQIGATDCALDTLQNSSVVVDSQVCSIWDYEESDLSPSVLDALVKFLIILGISAIPAILVLIIGWAYFTITGKK